MFSKQMAAMAAGIAGLALLTACGSGGSGGDTGAITLGFSQVGAESGWRTANTKSIQESAKTAAICRGTVWRSAICTCAGRG